MQCTSHVNARSSPLQVMSIKAALPVLEELHLCGNGIDTVGDPDKPIQGYSSLQVRAGLAL